MPLLYQNKIFTLKINFSKIFSILFTFKEFFSGLLMHPRWTIEIFKPYPFAPSYLVSNKGRVWSSHTQKFLKSFNRDGYRQLNINLDGAKNRRFVHQIVAQTFIPNPLNLPTVNHKNFIKDDNSVVNLEWMSYEDNIRHAYKSGKIVGGSQKSVKTKLTKGRICLGCGTMKPFSEYSKGSGKYGYSSRCKECESLRFKVYYQDNKSYRVN